VRELVPLLISNAKARGSRLSSCQQIELNSFHREAIFDLRDHITKYTRTNVLKTYFHLFDELFFGSLGIHCELRSSVISPRTDGAELTGRSEELGGGRNRIIINLRESEGRTRSEALSRYVGTLLHEMIHVFIYCWACDHGRCADGSGSHGRGHGPVWQDAAYALELAAKERGFLGLNISLRRLDALAMEVHMTSKWPTASMLARWNLSENDLRCKYQVFRILEE
jgi:hypothetical protein